MGANLYQAARAALAAAQTPEVTELQVDVERVRPPIPVRCMDWRATVEGYEPGDAMGWGPTRSAAIADLLDQLTGAA